MLSFGRCGRENQRKFSDNTFAIQKDSRGIEHVEFQMSERTKNHIGDQTDDDFERNPRVYATGNDNYPIKSFQKYMSKRCTSSTHFFQQPRAKVNKDDIAWYTSRPVGEKMLNDMMKQIFTEAKLNKIYTNHCVRATTVTVLSHAGVSNRKIMKITGHKCESSLSYNADSSEAQKRKYSGILQGKSPSNQTVTSNAVEMSQNPVNALPAPLQNVTLNNTNINTRMSVPTYSKQFEINHSSVQIFNYHVPEQLSLSTQYG
ncbi:KCTD1_15 [Mytilus coruscus]|uniref:KCTD1_15 n=1 Tax=Mytilus coruscus TaxID=42192 RepID=A0A6J8A5Y7_MYTCO|nr:KCTD1_15 [Mytilus coruscus]